MKQDTHESYVMYISTVCKWEDIVETAHMDPTILLTTSWILALQSTSRQGLPGPSSPAAKITPTTTFKTLSFEQTKIWQENIFIQCGKQR